MHNHIQPDIINFGARFILEQAALFESEIDGALISDDIEHIHRMRVASRRLRTALRLFNEYFPENYAEKWRSEMKAITRALGNARDLDVQIQFLQEEVQKDLSEQEKPGYEYLLQRLNQQRTKTQKKVSRAIHCLSQNQTLDQIHKVLIPLFNREHGPSSPSLFALARQNINEALTTFLSYRDEIQAHDNSDKLHAMRIAGKHLRYTMEIFSPLYQEGMDPHIEMMKGIQDQLGEIHDCDVWIVWLPEFIQEEENRITAIFDETLPQSKILPGIQRLIENRKQKRDIEYETFVSNWRRLEMEQTWVKLRMIIQNTGSELTL